ncbi:unnamed protein product [Calypogeia fissa]
MAALRIAPTSSMLLHANPDSTHLASTNFASIDVLPTKFGHSSAPVTRRFSIHATATRDGSSTGDGDGGRSDNRVMAGRREALSGMAALVAAMGMGIGPALAEKPPKGFSAVLDNADGYAFLYPFGWQEVAVKGQDVAFKDVIEPLESVGVSIVKTDKTSLEELGSPDEVARALVEKVLSSPTQKTALKEAKARVTNGRTYYQFEFVVQAKNFTRHALGAVAVNGGKFFTLTTGANERRWEKIEDKLRQVVDSFQTL